MKSTYIKRNGHERTRLVKKNQRSTPLLRRQAALLRREQDLISYNKDFKDLKSKESLTEKEEYQLELINNKIPRLKAEINDIKNKL